MNPTVRAALKAALFALLAIAVLVPFVMAAVALYELHVEDNSLAVDAQDITTLEKQVQGTTVKLSLPPGYAVLGQDTRGPLWIFYIQTPENSTPGDDVSITHTTLVKLAHPAKVFLCSAVSMQAAQQYGFDPSGVEACISLLYMPLTQ